MRKRIALIVVLLGFISLLTICAYAHPGRTDESGGHVDQSTGEYHYHHGYEAHSHYDMDGDGDIDCPYNFVDKTGQNSGDSSDSNSNTGIHVETRAEGGGNMNWTYWVIGGLLFVILCLSFTLYCRQKQMKHEVQKLTEERQKELQHIATVLASFDKDLRGTFGIDYLSIASGAKYGETLDDDFLPTAPSFDKEPWGKYTLYVPRTYADHAKYHYPNCRYAVGGNAKNALELFLLRDSYSSCKVCYSKIPDVSWAVKTRSYTSFLMQYAPDSVTALEARARNSKPNSYEEKAAIASLQKALSKYIK